MYELQVEGMSCNHCVSTVTKTVKEIDPQAKVEVDLAKQQVRIDSTAKLDELAAAVNEAGYPVNSSKNI